MFPAWAEHRRVLLEATGGGDLALLEAMVRRDVKACEAVICFCEAVMQAKEEAEHEGGNHSNERPGKRGATEVTGEV